MFLAYESKDLEPIVNNRIQELIAARVTLNQTTYKTRSGKRFKDDFIEKYLKEQYFWIDRLPFVKHAIEIGSKVYLSVEEWASLTYQLRTDFSEYDK